MLSPTGCAAQLPEGRPANGIGSGKLVAMATVVFSQLFRVRKSYSSPAMVKSYIAQTMF